MIPDVSAKKKKEEYPRAELKVSYRYPHKRLRTDVKAYDAEYDMLLLANSGYSKFFSPRTEYLDSLQSTPSGETIFNRMMREGVKRHIETGDDSFIPQNQGSLYVFKSLSDSTVTVYDKSGMLEKGCYTESLDDFVWEIGDSIKTLLGYECMLAETDYHGRHWKAWFTPEIPLHDGPWKLCGLPGLILEASESSGQHRFIATGIEQCNQTIVPVYSPKRYDRMTRKEMLSGMRQYLLNGDIMVKAVLSNTPSGERIEINTTINDSPDLDIDFLETDYHE